MAGRAPSRSRLSITEIGEGADGESKGIVARISGAIQRSSVLESAKTAASNTGYVSKRILKSTGKAAWIAGTTFLVLVVPLIIEMDREQQLSDLESQQATLLGASPSPSLPAPAM